MIIGNGLLAKALKKIDNDNILWFASGVSDSKTTRLADFEREKQLLLKSIETYHDKKLVYFSTYSILDPTVSTYPYIAHKLNIENLIKNQCTNYYIVRTSNVFGHKGNPKTILNYICNSIKNKVEFEVWEKAYRNLLDVDDLVVMLDYLIDSGKYSNEIVYLVNPLAYSIPNIVDQCEDYLITKAKVNLINKGINFDYPTTFSSHIFEQKKLYSENYLLKLLRKYY